jgi:8-oxo-dGTP pyrophosphatase MutT (NUDIX family)
VSTHRDFVPPSGLVARARDWLADPADPVPARAASTVVLVREGPDGPEVFLMRRQLTMAFAAGMAVFPGGGVDARDGDDVDLPWAGPAPARWARRLGVGTGTAVGLVCAAVRETFEECGVLLATAPGSDAFPTVDDEGWEDERQRLLARDVALSDLLTGRGLVLRSDLLRAWARWTTPEFEPRRYDTWFFLARLPSGAGARHLVGGEASGSAWWPAREAVDAHHRGEMALLPPTLVTLEEVAAAPTAAALVAAGRVLTAVMPEVVDADGTLVLRSTLPDQPAPPS